jgi:RNA polymerase sigma-70 factor (ECF subfamily)
VTELDFEGLWERHAQRVYGFLAYRTGDRALAEDLLADTFERVLTRRRSYDPAKGSESGWLYAIALNVLRSHSRRMKAESRALERSAAGGRADYDPLTAVEARGTLETALRGLSAEEREAIALRYGAELTVPEAAEAVGESLTTLEGRVYRALRKLREALEESSRLRAPP